jgi:hypothetical protein
MTERHSVGGRTSSPSLATKIAAAIGAATLLLGAFKGLMAVIPDTVSDTQKAFVAMRSLVGMYPPKQMNDLPNGLAPQVPSAPPDSELGTPPNPNCHIIMSVDGGVFPPKVVREWKC